MILNEEPSSTLFNIVLLNLGLLASSFKAQSKSWSFIPRNYFWYACLMHCMLCLKHMRCYTNNTMGVISLIICKNTDKIYFKLQLVSAISIGNWLTHIWWNLGSEHRSVFNFVICWDVWMSSNLSNTPKLI